MASIEVNPGDFLSGFQAFRELMHEAGRGGPVMAKIARDVGKFEVQQQRKNFASEGEASGEAWEKLGVKHPHYERWKKRNWRGRKLLVWTGNARDSLTKMSHPEHIARSRGNVLEFGTSNRIIRKNQEGEKHGSWQRVYLKEKKPYFSRDPARRRRQRGGRNWFVFWYKEIPARPAVRKSPTQRKGLTLMTISALMTEVGRRSKGDTKKAIVAGANEARREARKTLDAA